MDFLGRPGKTAAGAIILLLLFLAVPGGGTARAEPGDEWVFGVDAPVAADRAYLQYQPDVSGDHVFWEDNRPGEDNQVFTRIFFRDLGDPDNVEKPLTPGPEYFLDLEKGQFDPAVDGTVVAWREAVKSPSGGRAYEIRFIDFGDGCLARSDCDVGRIPVQNGHHVKPVVSGTNIIWQDERNGREEADIYLYDIVNGEVNPVCTLPGWQAQPDADGDWVAWVDNRDGEIIRGHATNNDIYVKNIITGEERQVTADADRVFQQHPAVGGDVVVYMEQADDASRSNIVAYRISTGTREVVYAGTGTDQRPDIDGSFVVWEACPDGISACGIWIHDLETGFSQPVSFGPRSGAGADPGNAGFAAVDAASGRIVWQDDRDGGRAIYGNRIMQRSRELAERYRPELRLSAGEYFSPAPVELMLELPGTFLRRWPNSIADPMRNPGIADLAACGEPDCYVDMMGSSVESGGGESSCTIDQGLIYRTYVKPVRAHADAYPPTVYARVRDYYGETVIQYWMHYVANDHPQLFHEGDWEMIQVRLDGRLRPYRADYSQHGSGLWRYWDTVERGSGGSRPVVYVASGSHAGYFRPGEHNIVPYQAWDMADGNGETIVPSIRMIPERDQAREGLAWLGFPGAWGERTDATMCLPEIPGIFSSRGHRDGPPGPAFQGIKWDDPPAWLDDSRCDGCREHRSEGAVLGVTASFGMELHLYDEHGNHTGADGAGGIDREIPGVELLEYEEPGTTVLQAAGADPDSIYRIVLAGVPAGTTTIAIPDVESGTIHTLEYGPYSGIPGTTAWISIDGSHDYRLSVDTSGDGVADFEAEPTSDAAGIVDFTPPAAVTDIVAVSHGTGAVTLSFTAPGDDGNEGSAAVYDVRYSTMPIDAASWYGATPFTPASAPQPAGTSEEIVVDGLAAGTTWYFAVKAIDDSARAGMLSNIAVAATPAPELSWYRLESYWASYADYRQRELSVDYIMHNKGDAQAIGARVEASLGVPSEFRAVTPMPLEVGDIESDSGRRVTIRYYAPQLAASFVAMTYATCRDEEGGEYWFPEPMIQTIDK